MARIRLDLTVSFCCSSRTTDLFCTIKSEASRVPSSTRRPVSEQVGTARALLVSRQLSWCWFLASQTDQAKLEFVNGLIKLNIFLPAKQEKCEFTLKLYNDTVGTLAENIKAEDKSIEKAHIYAIGKRPTRLDSTRLISAREPVLTRRL